jgi:histone-lysine N-methyltransferase SETMAR
MEKGLKFGPVTGFSTQIAVKQFMAQISITEMEHPPYSPDLAPNDLWMFSEVKSSLKGRRFQDIEVIQKKRNVTTTLKAIPQEFQKYFQR